MINSNPSTTCNNNTKSANKVEQNNSNENARAAVKATEIVDWLGTLPLSKPVHNPPGRDLSDAVLVAEIIAHFLPRYVILSTFAHVHSLALKKYNWETLDKMVLRHLGIRLGHENIHCLAQGEECAIQSFLLLLRQRINEAIEQRRFRPSSRSRPSSRGGSQLHLDQLDPLLDQNQLLNGMLATMSTDATNKKTGDIHHHHNNPAGPSKSAITAKPLSSAAAGIMPDSNEMQKEMCSNNQLIERLYMKLRAQELELAKKDEQIAMMKMKVNKLVELICEKSTCVNNMEQLLDDFDY